MASTWMTSFFLLGALATTIHAQVFNMAMSEYTMTYEGQIQPLIISISRTGPTDQMANVTLMAYEVSDNYQLQWEIPVLFLPGDATRDLPLGVIDDAIDEPDRIYIFQIGSPSAGYTLGSQDRALVGFVDNDGPQLFDCRTGDVCQQGTCNSVTGYCVCPTGFAFADCRLNLNDLQSTPCTGLSCGVGGVCVSGVSGTSCVCQPGYGGATCTLQQKYDVMCYDNGMCLNVDPPSGYVGARHIRNKGGAAACTLQDVTSTAITQNNLPSHWTGSYICLPHQHTECGNAEITVKSNGFSTRSRQVHIRLTDQFIVQQDIIFTGHCEYDSNGVLYFNHNVDPITGLIPVNATDTVNPASIFMVDRKTGQQSVRTEFNVGDEVCFAILLDSGFSSIRIDNVIADDTSANPETLEIVRNGCPVPNQVNVLSRLPWLPDNTNRNLVYFCLNAFTFDGSSQIGIRFETTVCAVSDTECTPYTCSGTTSYGRKKRETNDASTVLMTTIKVVDPVANAPTSERNTGSALPECRLSMPIIAALVVLAVFTLILLFTTLLLLVRTSRSRGKSHQ